MIDEIVIRLKRPTRDRIISIGRMDQTYDDVISILLDEYMKNHTSPSMKENMESKDNKPSLGDETVGRRSKEEESSV